MALDIANLIRWRQPRRYLAAILTVAAIVLLVPAYLHWSAAQYFTVDRQLRLNAQAQVSVTVQSNPFSEYRCGIGWPDDAGGISKQQAKAFADMLKATVIGVRVSNHRGVVTQQLHLHPRFTVATADLRPVLDLTTSEQPIILHSLDAYQIAASVEQVPITGTNETASFYVESFESSPMSQEGHYFLATAMVLTACALFVTAVLLLPSR